MQCLSMLSSEAELVRETKEQRMHIMLSCMFASKIKITLWDLKIQMRSKTFSKKLLVVRGKGTVNPAVKSRISQSINR